MDRLRYSERSEREIASLTSICPRTDDCKTVNERYAVRELKLDENRNHGRRLREDWGDGPPKISKSSLIGCVAKYELTKKRCHEGMFCCEIEVFRQEKGNICYII